MDATVLFLAQGIRNVRLGDEFFEIVPEEFEKGLNNMALSLSAAITDYLTGLIRYFTSKSGRANPFVSMPNPSIGSYKPAPSLFESPTGFNEARKTVESALKSCVEFYTVESSIVGRQILKQNLNKQRQKILDWIWSGDYAAKQRELSKRRTSGTGNWFLQSSTFKEWEIKNEPRLIICYGPRISSSLNSTYL